MYQPTEQDLQFIRDREGLRLQAYQDSAGIFTIGYGSISYEDGRAVAKGDVITKDRAEFLLHFEASHKSQEVQKLLGREVNSHQMTALVDFAYNLGAGALAGSGLLKRIKANPTDPQIRTEFLKWDKAHVNGKLVSVPGLTTRRKLEAALYFK